MLKLFTPELLQRYADDLGQAKQVDFSKTAPAPADQTARRAQVQAAINAIEAQRKFVAAHREDGVVPYFWAKYSDEARRQFLPLDRLRALAKSLER